MNGHIGGVRLKNILSRAIPSNRKTKELASIILFLLFVVYSHHKHPKYPGRELNLGHYPSQNVLMDNALVKIFF